MMRDRSEIPTIDLDIGAIVEVLDAAPVTRGILFGSFARGDERTISDVDLAVAFDASLSSMQRTRARLRLIEQVSAVLGLDEVDVIPISEAPADLRREINQDGIVLYGRPEPLPVSDDSADNSHEDRIARFDELLADLERVV